MEGDYVRVFDEGKGNHTSRKETINQSSERKYRVSLNSRDMMTIQLDTFQVYHIIIQTIIMGHCFRVMLIDHVISC